MWRRGRRTSSEEEGESAERRNLDLGRSSTPLSLTKTHLVATRGRRSRGKGDLVDDLNAGGAGGGRWAILRAMADWRDGDGRRRTKLMQNSLLVARWLALSHKEILPWFAALNTDTSEMLPGEVAEIHLDTALIRLHSDDYNPMESKKEGGTRRTSKGVSPARHEDAPGGFY